MRTNYLYEVVPIRLFLIVMLVFYHAFAIYSGNWTPIDGYPDIPFYSVLDKLSYSALLETFVFISGYILGYQVKIKGESVLAFRNIFQKKVKRQIVPSMIFSLLYLFIFGDIDQHVIKSVYNVLCGVGHMWFLPMLFWCFVGVYLIEYFKFSVKIILPILFFAMFTSALPLPFRLNATMYYLIFFYCGYLLQKYKLELNINRAMSISLLCFILTFIVKINLSNIIMIGGGIFSNQYLAKIMNFVASTLIRGICASCGILALLSVSLWLVKTVDTTKWGLLLKLSDCCLGVYLFQQFILKIMYNSVLPYHISAYVLPWAAFIFTLLLSLAMTWIFRKTKLGRSLL